MSRTLELISNHQVQRYSQDKICTHLPLCDLCVKSESCKNENTLVFVLQKDFNPDSEEFGLNSINNAALINGAQVLKEENMSCMC